MFRNSSRNFPCEICQCANYSSVQRQRHKARDHYCYSCHKHFLIKANHQCAPVQVGTGSFDPSPMYLSQSGLESFQVYRLDVNPKFLVVSKLMKHYRETITRVIVHCLEQFKNIKARCVLRANLVQLKTDERKQTDLAIDYETLFHKKDIDRFLHRQTTRIIIRLNFYNSGGSSWTVERFPFLDFPRNKVSTI
jgi:hypothetical protein